MNAPTVMDNAPHLATGARAWPVFLRLELIGPIQALANHAELLSQDADGQRPDEYLADVLKLRQAADGFLTLAAGLLTIGEEATATDLHERLRRARHDLGNRLNHIVGMVQLLQLTEDAHFGGFDPDLVRMHSLCRECEARLLRQGSQESHDPHAPPRSPEKVAEIARIVSEANGLCEAQPAGALTGSVLIADDDPLNREVLRRLLKQQGHTVAEAADGGEALRILATRSFDVLLLDILMPGLNGFQVLERLRDPGPRCPSVIVVSALDEMHGLVRCLEAGAEDYLTKPVDRAQLRARINASLLRRRQRARELEQFFPPEVVAQLLDNPAALACRNADVTVLFCDIRGFSRISERLQDMPEQKLQWVNAVLEALDESVVRHQGVLIDLIGDELVAMWGAPHDQPDHACLACRAALDMLTRVAALSTQWQAVIGEETAVGIGINSGPASVGNVGTHRRFKYGPIGDTVNLASRMQGATKYLGAPILLTQATRDALGDDFVVRRLGRVRVVNVQQPVMVYELVQGNEPSWAQLKQDYEEALSLFESGPDHLEKAARILGRLVTPFGLTGPTLFLMSRILGAMQDRAAWSDVCVLPGK
jgi:adenylate cyclase